MSVDDSDRLPPAPGPIDRDLSSAGIPGLSAAVCAKLAKGLGVRTVRDLLEQVPRRYIDLSRTKPIGEVKIGEDVTTRGRIVKVDGRYVGRSKRHLLVVTIGDQTGYLELSWWNQPFRTRSFTQGEEVAVAGRIERNRGKPSITNPFVETLRSKTPGIHVGRIIPVHPATQGVTTTQLRRYVHDALERFGAQVPEPLPDDVLDAHKLSERPAAIREMHFPTSQEARARARRRLVFEELFVLSSGLALRKRRLAEQALGLAHAGGEELVDRFLSSLPFEPTGAQRRAIGEIAADMATEHPMNRLLQGEVGSGKTVVALAAALAAQGGGSQTAFMAPTEVLAEQHYLTVRRLLDPLASEAPSAGRLFGEGFEVVLLTGSVTGKQRAKVLEAVASGEAMMLVGTHALIQEGVEFDRLGLAIVDEQHRFGVHQRVSLRGKGREGAQPDTLIMTATPIPRTLALTLYGDVDVSTLDQMPVGRTPVKTAVVADDAGREAAYQDIRAEVASGRQAFVICSLVEDSPSLEAKAAESEFERLRAEVFAGLRVGLIHGRMKSGAKEEVMRAVRSGEVDVLVATTVIEVGVDIPNATVMVIEDADRFGLSQLHQLRGRIGRGAHASRCYLFTTAVPEADDARVEAMARLRAMEKTNDGFKLAEMDLEIRGAGQLFGRGSVEESKGAPLQAGRGDLRFANLVHDVETLLEARAAAFALVESDPTLTLPSHRALMEEVRRRFADRLDWLFAS